MPRILIADDDALVRRFLEQALEFAGYDVIAAADGVEAVEILDRERNIDVVVTDYAMPRASGLDVVAHAHRVDPGLPCIIVTAFRDLDLAMKGMQAGAVGFIPKPFKADHLITVVARAVERRALANEAVRLRMLTPMLERFTMVLSNTLESKDLSTRHHSERLVNLSDRIGAELGLPEDERRSIRLGACLHDIGKVGVPEYLLRKAGRLTDAEFAVVRQHPQIGATILEDIDAWAEVRDIVRHHHERYDGGGYPARLAGKRIPLGARIVTIVDSFDVMRVGRPYCKARSIDAIIAEFVELRGQQFDPELVDIFLSILETADLSEFDHYRAIEDIGPSSRAGWLLPEVVPIDSATA